MMRGLLAPAPLGKVFTLQPEKNAFAFFRNYFDMLREGVAAPGLCLTATPLASPIVADRNL